MVLLGTNMITFLLEKNEKVIASIVSNEAINVLVQFPEDVTIVPFLIVLIKTISQNYSQKQKCMQDLYF